MRRKHILRQLDAYLQHDSQSALVPLRQRYQRWLREYDAYVAERGLDPEETDLFWCNGAEPTTGEACNWIHHIPDIDRYGEGLGPGGFAMVHFPCAACGNSLTVNVRTKS